MAEVRTHGSVLHEPRGGGRECPPEAQALLLDNTDRWSPNDLGPAACPMDDKDDVAALWTSIFEDIAGEEEDTPIMGSIFARFMLWAHRAVDVDRGEGTSEPDEYEEGISIVPSRPTTPPPAKGKKKGPKPKAPLSAPVLEALAAQRATHPGQIGYLNAALFLGQHPSKAECEGLGVGDLAASSEVIRKSVKFGRSSGMKTLVDALDAAKSAGNARPLDHFFERLQSSLTTVTDDHADFAPQALGLSSQLYTRAKSVANPEFAVVAYIEDYVFTSHRGEGVPIKLDHEAMARSVKLACSSAQSDAATPGKDGLASMQAMSLQIAELVGEVKKVAGIETRIEQLSGRMDSRMDAFSTRINKLAEKVGGGGGGGGGAGSPANAVEDPERDRHITCSKCGLKGHRERFCPSR